MGWIFRVQPIPESLQCIAVNIPLIIIFEILETAA